MTVSLTAIVGVFRERQNVPSVGVANVKARCSLAVKAVYLDGGGQSLGRHLSMMKPGRDRAGYSGVVKSLASLSEGTVVSSVGCDERARGSVERRSVAKRLGIESRY